MFTEHNQWIKNNIVIVQYNRSGRTMMWYHVILSQISVNSELSHSSSSLTNVCHSTQFVSLAIPEGANNQWNIVIYRDLNWTLRISQTPWELAWRDSSVLGERGKGQAPILQNMVYYHSSANTGNGFHVPTSSKLLLNANRLSHEVIAPKG